MLVNDLGRFVAELSPGRLPADVVSAIELRILDVIGAGIAGCRLGAHERLLPLLGTGTQASVWGAGLGLPLRDAALVNSFMAHSTYLEDGSRYTGGHPSSVVVPAALALGEMRRASGADVVAAVTAGYEVFLRLGRAIYPSTVVRGFQSTAVLGAVSSAAACASLLRLDAEAAKNALAIACNLGVGLKEALKASDSQPIQVGRSVDGGILAAQFAAQGATGADAIIEEGFLKGFSTTTDGRGIVAGLGTEFRVGETYLKVHAGCRGNHAPIDVAQETLAQHGIAPDRIATMTMHVDTVTYAAEVHEPRNGDQAQFSIAFSVAVALLEGNASVFQYTDARLAEARVRSLMDRIRVVVDQSLDEGYPDRRGARVEIELTDGRRLEGAIDNARGEPECPLAPAALQKKFVDLARPALGANAERACELAGRLSRLEDVSQLTACLRRA